VPVSACIVANSHDGAPGSLKIKSGSKVTQFSEGETVMTFGRPEVGIPLEAPFEINAQTNSDADFVLHVEIRNGSKVVSQDEASGFGLINIDSDSLG
jgi:hypothetical protein